MEGQDCTGEGAPRIKISAKRKVGTRKAFMHQGIGAKKEVRGQSEAIKDWIFVARLLAEYKKKVTCQTA